MKINKILVMLVMLAVVGTTTIFTTPVSATVNSSAEGTETRNWFNAFSYIPAADVDTMISMQNNIKEEYLSGKLDNLTEQSKINVFESYGLSQDDYENSKRQRFGNSTKTVTASKTPTISYGWAKNTDGKWYYSGDGESWETNCWKEIDGLWYYFDGSSQAVIGWNEISDKWYYFWSDCSMACDTVVDNYRLSAEGDLRIPSNVNFTAPIKDTHDHYKFINGVLCRNDLWFTGLYNNVVYINGLEKSEFFKLYNKEITVESKWGEDTTGNFQLLSSILYQNGQLYSGVHDGNSYIGGLEESNYFNITNPNGRTS